VSIYCALLTPQWKQSIRSSSMQAGETWSKCSIARLYRQNRKFPPIWIITEAKNAYFFVCKRTGFVHQELRDFVKMTLTRVSSHWLWLESSQVILWKTWPESSLVSIFLNVTPVKCSQLSQRLTWDFAFTKGHNILTVYFALRPIYTEELPRVATNDSLFVLLRLVILGLCTVNGQWFIVSYDSANKQKYHKSHRMQ